jgi:hypothetical protein
MPAHATSRDKLAALESRIEVLEADLQSATRKAVAVLATLLGTGGVASVLQIWMGARVQREERDFKAREQKLKEESIAIDNRLKDLDRQLKEIELEKRRLAIWKEQDQLIASELEELKNIVNPALLPFFFERVKLHLRSYHGILLQDPSTPFSAPFPQQDRPSQRWAFVALFTLAYDLQENGQIIRLAQAVLREALAAAVFNTGEAELNNLLETARVRFLSPDLRVRKDALEKIWDAWERLKTIENPNDKRTSITMLLDRPATERNFRQTIEAEARSLTDIGNAYMIRHAEVGKIPIETPEQIDYLFHRMFASIRLLLRATGRGG